jgi:hypothetical protein
MWVGFRSDMRPPKTAAGSIFSLIQTYPDAGRPSFTGFGTVHSQMPSNEGCRKTPSLVHVVNFTAAAVWAQSNWPLVDTPAGADAKGESLR